ncbi:hypothetical protein [Algoriphagus boritolerans]|uniref:hypothetical protein n=1 Tax=Algoriphagus boritolerans TaxID=308111 RepID=UPI002FCE5D20
MPEKNNAKTYLARYAAKRNPKNFEDVKPAEHTFYERVGDTWEALSQRGEELVGMQKNHFKQTVIIPQGKFREFIDLTPGPRAEMMKELFGLERFDLSGKTGTLLKAVREEKIRLETQLLALEAFTKENLAEKKTHFDKLTESLTHAESIVKQADQEFRAKEILRNQHQELLKYQSLRTELLEKKAGNRIQTPASWSIHHGKNPPQTHLGKAERCQSRAGKVHGQCRRLHSVQGSI